MSRYRKCTLSLAVFFMPILVCFSGYLLASSPERPESDQPVFQCRIKKQSGSAKTEITNCSGTYLNDHVFLTAAHCFAASETGPVPSDSKTYSVKCEGFENKRLLAIVPHPLFYRASDMDGSNGNRRLVKYKYNDMAVVITEPIALKRFPDLPEPADLPNYVKRSCRMLGFASDICQQDGVGCFRQGLSMELPEFPKFQNICDRSSGKGCYLSSEFREETSPERPLELNLQQPGLDHPQISSGDSGAGVLCSTGSGREILAGVISTRSEPQVINTINKLNFVRYFMNLSLQDAISRSKANETPKTQPRIPKSPGR